MKHSECAIIRTSTFPLSCVCVCVFLNYLALSGNLLGIGDLTLHSAFLLFICPLSSPAVGYRCFSFVTMTPFFCNFLQSQDAVFMVPL